MAAGVVEPLILSLVSGKLSPTAQVRSPAFSRLLPRSPAFSSLVSGKLSPTAQEHAATIVHGLAPSGTNAAAIKDADGIEPLVNHTN